MLVREYASAGFRVFGLHELRGTSCGCDNEDCQAAGKHPRIEAWQHTPQWSEQQLDVMEMTGQFKTGFGVLCDGYLVIDIDPRNGGNDGYQALVKKTGIDYKAHAGFVVKTGGGGWHIYYKMPHGADVNKNCQEFKGIDFKYNGFVVGCGSQHKSGDSYTVEIGSPKLITEAPQELIAAISRQRTAEQLPQINYERKETDAAELLQWIPNHDCDYDTWLAVGMAIHHATRGNGLGCWVDWSSKSTKHNVKGMAKKWQSFHDVTNPITGATLYQMAVDNGYVEQIQPLNLALPWENTKQKTSDGCPVDVNTIDLATASGLVGDVIDFINSQSRYPRKQLAVAAALTAIGNIGGLRYRDLEFGVTANLFSFCVAGSATGKEAIQQAAREVMAAAGMAPAVYGAIKSEQELTRNCITHQISAYIIDEFGIFLQKLSNAGKSGASYLEGVIGALMSIYSKADGTLLLGGDQYKDVAKELRGIIQLCEKAESENESNDAIKKRLESAKRLLDEMRMGGIAKPFLSLLGFTTPVTFNSLVSFEQATNGFIGRALIFEEKDTNPRAKRGFMKIPMSTTLKMQIASLANAGSYDSIDSRIEWTADHDSITTEPQALALLDDVQDYLESLADYHVDQTGLEAVVRRAFEQVLKVSMILAIGDGAVRRVGHVSWAFALVKRDIENKIKLATGNMAQTERKKTEEVISKVHHALDHNHAVTAAAIANRHRSIDKQQIQDALNYLVSTGDAVELPPNPTAKKKAVSYKLV